MAGDDLELGIEQDRHIEAEGRDAAGDLPDLLAGVPAGIGGIISRWIGRQTISIRRSRLGRAELDCILECTFGCWVDVARGAAAAPCRRTGASRNAKRPPGQISVGVRVAVPATMPGAGYAKARRGISGARPRPTPTAAGAAKRCSISHG